MKRTLIMVIAISFAIAVAGCSLGGQDPAAKKALDDLSAKVATIETTNAALAPKLAKLDSMQMQIDNLTKDVEDLIKDVDDLKKATKTGTTKVYHTYTTVPSDTGSRVPKGAVYVGKPKPKGAVYVGPKK